MIEKRGRVDVIREDLAVSGTYHVLVDESQQPPTAKGTVHVFDPPYLVHRALAVERVLFCFDGHVELEVEITLYVPSASLITFTCRDATRLLTGPA